MSETAIQKALRIIQERVGKRDADIQFAENAIEVQEDIIEKQNAKASDALRRHDEEAYTAAQSALQAARARIDFEQKSIESLKQSPLATPEETKEISDAIKQETNAAYKTQALVVIETLEAAIAAQKKAEAIVNAHDKTLSEWQQQLAKNRSHYDTYSHRTACGRSNLLEAQRDLIRRDIGTM